MGISNYGLELLKFYIRALYLNSLLPYIFEIRNFTSILSAEVNLNSVIDIPYSLNFPLDTKFTGQKFSKSSWHR